MNCESHIGENPLGPENVTNNTEQFVNTLTVKAVVLEKWNEYFCLTQILLKLLIRFLGKSVMNAILTVMKIK